jgi:hypothetical protein
MPLPSTKCAIKLSENRTPFFVYKKGVRQGCILSPLLFNIYINELPKLFEMIFFTICISKWNCYINIVFYTPMILSFSHARSKSDLQNRLDQLHEWCRKWLMEANTKGKKITIFQKHNSKLPNLNFSIGDN